ncbi:chemotaxis protein CheA [uncultured Jannaschia sp.]|uniref:chemotaxis protein CheA n=1 Tax=uncultured Jannaschia sp. TaxID=293347 RepID=UPI002638CD7C|nr:chemotaxis protein CheA [uncultured Jannaschia sp.]
MAALDAIRATFFEECEDLIEALNEGLGEMAGGDHGGETVNAVFRAVHSIKGGAGSFGLNDLVGFAHTFETVLDRIRSGDLEPADELIALLQRAGDVLADLVETARDESPFDAAAVSTTSDALEAVLGEEGAVEEEFVFDAVGADFDFALPDLDDDEPGSTTYTIAFAPRRDLYATGHEPLVLIEALADLGEIAVAVDLSGLPGIDAFDWEGSYLAWEITLVSSEPEGAVREVFEFVDGLCDLEITVVRSGGSGDATGLPELPDLDDFAPDDAADLPDLSVEPSPAASAETPARENAEPAPARKDARATLRVDVDRIDRLINTVGELIINQAMITQRVREIGVPLTPEIATDLDDYKQLAREVQEGVMGLRTQPVKQLFQRMTRIARETADVAGKSAQLVIEGEETEVDKKVIEKLADPLTHMIRNSIDHGLEVPEKRREAGKPERGTVKLTACYKSGDVLIRIADDGAGLNRPRIRQIAIEKGLIPADVDLSDAEIDQLLFRPGFSTAASVTSLSGRGVGMDVVRTSIAALGGRISIASTPGEGSVFSILLPLTLAVLDGMVVRLGEETMVVPIACIEEAIRPRKDDLSRLGTGRTLFFNRGDYLPVIDLAERLGHPTRAKKLTKKTLLIIQSNGSRVALAVDGVVDKRQVVIKSLAKNYRHIAGISAATILGDGKVALIVDPDGIAEDPPSAGSMRSRTEDETRREEKKDAA